MRPSLRFLGIALVGWTVFRATTLGALPGAEIFRVDPSEAKVPPIVPTQFPPIEPLASATAEVAPSDLRFARTDYPDLPHITETARTVVVPVYYTAPVPTPAISIPTRLANVLPNPRPQFYSSIPVLDEWPLSRIAASSTAPLRSTVATPRESLPVAIRRSGIDRVQLTAWTLLRAQSAAIAGTQSLASGGSLGASQAGARLMYNFTRQVAATLRTTSDVGRRGGEVAAGVRIQPLAGIPVWIDAERRQRIGRYGGGRSAFALFFEGGVYDRPMPARFVLDTYLQGGVVGLRSRDRFIDGALTLTHPVYKRFSAGLGVWGGAQPGVYRIDAGPRVTMRVRGNMRVHLDWRQRLAGNAEPASGPAITLAGDF